MMGSLLFAALVAAVCRPVEGDRILARDLAAADSAFASLPAEAEIGYAPAPGARRHLHASDLHRLAARYGLAPLAGEICFERPLEPLGAQRLMEAMRRSLGSDEASLEIADHSRQPAPRGQVVFPRSGLAAPSGPASPRPMLWRGFVQYGAGRRFPIWAKVRMQIPQRRVVALEDLAAGKVITAGQVRAETARVPPPTASVAVSLEEVVGWVPRRPIPRGTTLTARLLDRPKEVTVGAAVTVEAVSGSARIELVGRAESAGRRGEAIWVRNPASGGRFRARIQGSGRAVASGLIGRPLREAAR